LGGEKVKGELKRSEYGVPAKTKFLWGKKPPKNNPPVGEKLKEAGLTGCLRGAKPPQERSLLWRRKRLRES